MKLLKNKKIFIPIIALILIGTIIGISYGAPLYNDEELVQGSELIYYLDVYYDGVDKDGTKSSDTVVSDVNSGYMYIEDKIPNDLTFTGFVTTSNGSIGAVKRSDGSSCSGFVVDDTKEETVEEGTWNSDNTEYYYHGLHYNSSTRTVSFKVKNLKAGCKLTVGIKTLVSDYVDNPNTPDYEEKRIDFYNFATVRDNSMTTISNLLHGYMGKNGVITHSVNYQFTGNVPSNAPELPEGLTYTKGSSVGVSAPIKIEGYTFSGWTTNDVEVTDGSFVMPDHDVTFTGSYTQNSKYKVKYVINGTTPNGYTVPPEKEYYEENSVSIDDLTSNFNGYTFSGWTTSDVTIGNGEKIFIMPNHDVTFTGSFTEIKYHVTYDFIDTILPENADSLKPQPEEYSKGATVTLPTIEDVMGYHFIGWYKENNFVMPDEDITVYGEWKVQNGTFEPTIEIEIVDPKEVYRGDDVIKFKITVTNNASYPITDIIIKENNSDVAFINGDDYEVQSKHFARIEELAPGASKSVYSEYKVLKNDLNKLNNEVELVGALAENYQILKESNYKRSVSFDVLSNLIVHHYVNGTTTEVHEDEISEAYFGSTYTTNPIDGSLLNDEYRNKYKAISNSGNVNGIIDKNNVEVTYYYALEMYNISVSVVGGVGTVTGDETVIGGNDSQEDIVVKPNEGYEINKILINGEEVTITNPEEMTLDKFSNVREDKNIEVEFKEKPQATPITGVTVSVYLLINILVSIAIIMFYLYKKHISKKEGGVL